MTIERLLDDLIERESGYVNDADDRGGPTKYGITLRTLMEWRYPVPVTWQDVQELGLPEARQILRRKYIEAPGFLAITNERLLAFVVDYGVHSGQLHATRALQRVLGVDEDGVLGRKTKDAIAQREHDPAVYRALMADRLDFLFGLVLKNPSQRRFLDGWINRIVQFV